MNRRNDWTYEEYLSNPQAKRDMDEYFKENTKIVNGIVTIFDVGITWLDPADFIGSENIIA